MSDSEEEDNFRMLGTPLDPIEEGDFPKKKPFGIQDQIATDKHGRRRFHGAFTGGFSAGHFNSVGTPEGWKPTTFKSSRSTKQETKGMRPEDFMDDEDMDDFGIAPSVLRAKSEYSGSKAVKKRLRVNFQDGPIPGDPVLQSILEPSKDTFGVILLTKMGWKPGQGIGPRISKMEKRMQKRKTKLEKAKDEPKKVYGCAPKPPSSSEESDGSDEELNLDVLFAPDDVEIAFAKPKCDVFGMGYSGLDRTSVLSTTTNNPALALPDTFRMLDNNKKLAIRGQAFGVGAFENEDADIYARDDMSQYDFSLDTPASLREKRRRERTQKDQLLAITGDEDVIEGFVPAKNPAASKKYFPPPTLPPGFQPYHHARKSRFDSGPSKPTLPDAKEKKHLMNPEDRSIILGEKSSTSRRQEQKKEGTPTSIDDPALPDLPPPDLKDDHNFRPFLSDPPKQSRYEKYLQLVKIGAKDAFNSLQPKDMSEWEKERERTEFEQAAKLYRPLSGMMADRFARAELPDESLDPLAPVAKMSHGGVSADMVAAAKAKMFGKLTRTVEEWIPVALICKRMNIPEPLNRGGKSLCDLAKGKATSKSKFSVFDILVNSDNPFKSFETTPGSAKSSKPEEAVSTLTSAVVPSTPEEDNLPENIAKIHFDDLAEKKDLFKAIFCDSEDDEDEEPSAPTISLPVPPKPSEISQQNVLRNTSPPRGIFANLNFDKLNEKKPPDPPPVESIEESRSTLDNQPKTNSPEDLYGPALPNRPIFLHKPKNVSRPAVSSSSSSSSSEEDEWVEKKSSSSSSKKKKKNKDHRKEKKHRKKHSKHKEHKEHKRRRKDKKR